VFEHHRDKKAVEEYQRGYGAREAQRDSAEHLLEVAQTYAGETSSDLVLKPGEVVFASVTKASLVEERRGSGHWQGGSAGVSVPMGSVGGHPVRYRVGAARGHYVQGAPAPTAIDTGTVFVTNQRVVFQGANQTRECAFAKLLGVRHDDADGTTVLSVSNRQKPTTVHYGPKLSGWFDFRVDLALAHYRGQLPALVAQLEQDLANVKLAEPRPPSPPALR